MAKLEQIKMHGTKVYKPFKVLMDAGTVRLRGRNLSEILNTLGPNKLLKS